MHVRALCVILHACTREYQRYVAKVARLTWQSMFTVVGSTVAGVAVVTLVTFDIPLTVGTMTVVAWPHVLHFSSL